MICLAAIAGWSAPKNIALNMPYTVSPAPNYHLCTDADDLKQLTDGLYTKGYFWTQKGTVGWRKAGAIALTIDMGAVKPVSGVSWSCAAGTAGVTWPKCLYVLVSIDKKNWTSLGDLCVQGIREKLPPEKGYAKFRYATNNLKGYGRYLCVIAAAQTFSFVDEVEVWRGEDAWLNEPIQGATITDLKQFHEQHCVRSGVADRLRSDLNTILSQADAIQNAELLSKIKAQATALSAQIPPFAKAFPDNNKTVLPYDGLHEKILALHAPVLHSAGITHPLVWQNNRWDPLTLTDLPPDNTGIEALSLDLIRGEVRGESFNITQTGESPLEVSITLKGVPENLNLELCEVLFTDTSNRDPVAAALRLLKPDASRTVQISIPGGCTRQVWLSCQRPQGAATTSQGVLKLASTDGSLKKTIALSIRLRDIDLPKHPALHVGGWDYLQGSADYYNAPGNVKATLALMRDIYVDSPWATTGVFPKGALFNTKGLLKNETALDFAIWDAWVARWHGARNYCVFFNVDTSFHGEKMGTQRFNTMVASWLGVWVRHMLKQGLKPEQMVILLKDEPHTAEKDRTIITWAAAIKAANSGVMLFEDPTHRDPAKGDPAMFAACDILCPNTPMMLAQGKPFRDFYIKQRESGKTLWLYSCSGPAKLLDPIAYHRAQAWQAFQMGAKGTFFWAFGCGGGIGDSWHAYKQKGVEYSPWFVGPKSVMTGKHCEAIREGVQDYEVLLMLQKKAQNIRKRGGDTLWLMQAERVLTKDVAAVLQSVTASNLSWHIPKDRSLIDTVRIRVLDALEQAPQ